MTLKRVYKIYNVKNNSWVGGEFHTEYEVFEQIKKLIRLWPNVDLQKAKLLVFRTDPIHQVSFVKRDWKIHIDVPLLEGEENE